MTNNLSQFKSVVVANVLGSSQLLGNLPSEDLFRIAEFTCQKSLAKGEYLFHRGDTPSGVYIVQSGSINLHSLNAAGKQHVFHVLRPGESFGEGSLVSPEPCAVDARALEHSQVLCIQKAEFLAFLRRRPDVLLRLFAALNTYAARLLDQVEDLALTDVQTRLGRWLMRHCPDPASEVPARIRLQTSKRLLAAELGTVSETLSRTLAKFREQDLIEVQGNSLTVLNPGRMSRFLRLAHEEEEFHGALACQA